LDGTDTADNIIYLATTNYPERLSPRILRPGRFDRKIEVPYPPDAGREAYLKLKLQDEDVSPEQLQKLVKATKGFSFGHMRELVSSVWCLGQPLKDVLNRLKGNTLEKQVNASTLVR
jgi:ATP-dependent 26S proteasome regulatory subunit